MVQTGDTFPMKTSLTRRQFMVTTAKAAAATRILSYAGPAWAASPNDKLNVAVVGIHNQGRFNLDNVAHENVVALCDVDEILLAEAAKAHPKAKLFHDYRRLLEENNLDAVVVATPDHTHAVITAGALSSGRHAYCEKPLARTIQEARVITDLARRHNRVTQIGTQIHAGTNYRRVVELVQGGAIGAVREVHVWVNRTWGWQSPEDAKANQDRVSTQERPKEAEPVPPELDWDLWIGPAPWRPFNSVYIPGNKWYRWWDFGNGTMSDLGSHYNDLPFWALNLDAPTTIEASGPPPHPEIAPATMNATYQFPARGNRPAVKMVWYQGQMKPPAWMEKKIPQWPDGHLFIGEKGMLLCNYSKYVLLPEKDFAGFVPPPKTIPDSLGHHQEWVHACKTGAPTTCHFGYSGPLTEANHLGNVVYRSGKKIQWDAKAMKIPNAPEAERFLKREYRAGWKLG